MNDFRTVNLPVPWAPGSAPAKYCNSAFVLFSPWDFSFEFGQITPVVTPGASIDDPPQVQVAKVIHDWISMAPPHAKAFLRALSENIQRYEAEHGEIPAIAVPTQPIQGQP